MHYEAPAASRLDAEMTKVLSWFATDLKLDPVRKAGIAYLWFVTLHPFEGGNGRIARAIADMALARADGTSHRFYSMSRQIAQERKAYYTQFERQQKGGVDITSWLSWFLHCFSRAVVTAENTQMLIRHRIEGYAGTRRPPRSDSKSGRRTKYQLPSGYGTRTGAIW